MYLRVYTAKGELKTAAFEMTASRIKESIGFLVGLKNADAIRYDYAEASSDSDFTIAVEANSIYKVDICIYYISTVVPFLYRITLPTDGEVHAVQTGHGNTAIPTEIVEVNTEYCDVNASNNGVLHIHGTVTTGNTAGNLVFQWAGWHVTSPTIVKKGSYVSLMRLT